jgi:hypothetical protein
LNRNYNLTIGVAIIIIGLAGVFYYNFTSTRAMTLERAEGIAERYLDSVADPDIAIDEIMEFEYNFYVVYFERSTRIGAFEMLIDKENGRIFPEYGPNMMWNVKYGHGGMMGGPGMMGPYAPPLGSIVLDEEEATEIAQAFLDEVYPESEAEESHAFYGYYTIHTTKGGEVSGMLSVNEYTGAVWYHNWHGAYIQSKELHD